MVQGGRGLLKSLSKRDFGCPPNTVEGFTMIRTPAAAALARITGAITLALIGGCLIRAAEPPAETAKGRPANRLALESSPYLLQHAHNPVDWYPWGTEAFAQAKKDGKLVFLSIGYSSCHWCHVMERESFENAEVAKLLNQSFVCIKVDREERPDIDAIYMTSLQVLRQRGGWPLSMFLTADARPIIGGTYWPADDKEIDNTKIHGFKTILKIVSQWHAEKPKEIEDQAERVAAATTAALGGTVVPGRALIDLNRDLVTLAVQGVASEFDK